MEPIECLSLFFSISPPLNVIIYHKKLAQEIIKIYHSLKLKWKAGDLGDQWYSSIWKSHGFKTPKELMFELKSKGRKKNDGLITGGSASLFFIGL